MHIFGGDPSPKSRAFRRVAGPGHGCGARRRCARGFIGFFEDGLILRRGDIFPFGLVVLEGFNGFGGGGDLAMRRKLWIMSRE